MTGIVGRIAAMFQENDVIIYGTQGVCKIIGTEEKTVSGRKKTYFVLKPVGDKGATIFVPTDNEIVLGKMRRLLTKDEIHKLIESMRSENAAWIENENERRELFRSILVKGDHLELIRMLKAIYAHKAKREAEGKRLHMSDERFFKEAEQILYSEFQYVLDMKDKNDLAQYIFAQLEKK